MVAPRQRAVPAHGLHRSEAVRASHREQREEERSKSQARRARREKRDAKTSEELVEAGIEPNPGPHHDSCYTRRKAGKHPNGSCDKREKCGWFHHQECVRLIAEDAHPDGYCCNRMYLDDISNDWVFICDRMVADCAHIRKDDLKILSDFALHDQAGGDCEEIDCAAPSTPPAPLAPAPQAPQSIFPCPFPELLDSCGLETRSPEQGGAPAGTRRKLNVQRPPGPPVSTSAPVPVTASPVRPDPEPPQREAPLAPPTPAAVPPVPAWPAPPRPPTGPAPPPPPMGPAPVLPIPPPPPPPPLPVWVNVQGCQPLDGLRLAPGFWLTSKLHYISPHRDSVHFASDDDRRPVADRVGDHLNRSFYVTKHKVRTLALPNYRVVLFAMAVVLGLFLAVAFDSAVAHYQGPLSQAISAIDAAAATPASDPVPPDYDGMMRNLTRELWRARRDEWTLNTSWLGAAGRWLWRVVTYVPRTLLAMTEWAVDWDLYLTLIFKEEILLTDKEWELTRKWTMPGGVDAWYAEAQRLYAAGKLEQLIRTQALPASRAYAEYRLGQLAVTTRRVLSALWLGFRDAEALWRDVLSSTLGWYGWRLSVFVAVLTAAFSIQLLRFLFWPSELAYVPNILSGAITGTLGQDAETAAKLAPSKIRAAGRLNLIDRSAAQWSFGTLTALRILLFATPLIVGEGDFCMPPAFHQRAAGGVRGVGF